MKLRVVLFSFLLNINLFAQDTILPQEGLVLINEILFNPRVGGVDFVELYNHSNHYVDISACSFSNWDEETGEINKLEAIDANIVLAPNSYLLLTEDSLNIFQEYPEARNIQEIKDLPSYNNDKGSVLFLNGELNTLDRFDYEEEMHFSLIDDVEGISLERLHFDSPTNDPNNWHSAATTIYATPGYVNSQQVNTLSNASFLLTKEYFSPNQDGRDDQLSIQYELEQEGYVLTLMVYDLQGRKVKTLLNNELSGAQGIVTWDGIGTDGNLCATGVYIIYLEAFHSSGRVVKNKKGCVLLNE